MAYKVSYKVVSQQGEQLKSIAKDMDTYVSELDQIIPKLGNDELLQSVRNDLNKFKQQLEEEKTVLNLAGQVITDVVKSFTGVEKKSVQKVDKAKAHNRDFYKRPVSVASAGGGAGAATAAASAGSATAVNVSATTVNVQNTTNVTNVSVSASASAAAPMSAAAPDMGAVTDTLAKGTAKIAGAGTSAGGGIAAGIAAAAGVIGAAGVGVGGAVLADKKSDKTEDSAGE